MIKRFNLRLKKREIAELNKIVNNSEHKVMSWVVDEKLRANMYKVNLSKQLYRARGKSQVCVVSIREDLYKKCLSLCENKIYLYLS